MESKIRVTVFCFMLFLMQCFISASCNATEPDIGKFSGVYVLAEDGGGTILAGELVLKAQGKELVGEGEQRIMPMGASMKTQLRIYKIKASGAALFEEKWANFDRGGAPIQDGIIKGKALLKKNGMMLDKLFVKRKQ